MEIFGSSLTRGHVLKTCLALAAPFALAIARDQDEPPLHFAAKTIDGDKYSSDSLKGNSDVQIQLIPTHFIAEGYYFVV